MTNREYETVIGLEVHVELSTRTKIFCGCSTRFGDKPNTHTCPVCLGMPGALPVLNRQVLEDAIAVGLAFHSRIAERSRFDRKNYFYPDNPQNYQISQLYLPICRGGYVELDQDLTERKVSEGTDAEKGERDTKEKADCKCAAKRIRIAEIHMEEDAGKLIHDEKTGETYVDYNRSGVPLLEIVSEPDMRNAQEVIAYLEKIRTTLRYLGVSDCRMQEGSLRADVNLSVREAGRAELGTRTEMKNLSSFHAVVRAVEEESRRQIAILKAGGEVIQETRRWDEGKNTSYSMRGKEDAKDYRYFPDPDLGDICVSGEQIAGIYEKMPELREEKRQRFRQVYPIPDYDIDLLTQSRELADLFEAVAALGIAPKKASNWMMGELLRLMKERETDSSQVRISPEHFAQLIGMCERKEITNTVGKEIFEVMFEQDIDPAAYALQHGLKTVSDKNRLRMTVKDVLAENTKSVSDFRAGKEKAMGFLIGQTMKKMHGQADPEVIRQILGELLP
ncbi:MAG: Asp-tRNA(Asn)/Glu-tRNA(Gln) amidotransferase subunit GatB [Lachnospiraceae bacterium]|nr:Asp-tRNA(Asn)/Glu-tRNA(Gln) amidotransferase subunit GatB [Lachnospiraceae bacterium]